MIFRFFASFLIIAITLGVVGCKNLRKAVDATARLQGQVSALQESTEKSYDKGLIPKDIAQRGTQAIKDKLNPTALAYTNFVDNLKQAYPEGSGKKPTTAEWVEVRRLFRAFTNAFDEVVTIYGPLTDEQKLILNVSLGAIQEIVDLVLGAISKVEENIELGGPSAWRTLQTS